MRIYYFESSERIAPRPIRWTLEGIIVAGDLIEFARAQIDEALAANAGGRRPADRVRGSATFSRTTYTNRQAGQLRSNHLL